MERSKCYDKGRHIILWEHRKMGSREVMSRLFGVWHWPTDWGQEIWSKRVCRYSRTIGGTSLVQWLRIRLPVQGTQVRSLVQEDSTCHGAPEPVCPRAHALQKRDMTTMRNPGTAMRAAPICRNGRKKPMQQGRPSTAKYR